MGLGAPKRRNKLSHDPNNTAWSRSTSNFGHRILAQQGWQPGQYLGAENANHSDHYTAANASHIRVLLREDNLGLGAKVGGNKAETFGLSLFSGVLGRLNGKSEEQVQKQQDALRDAELRQYQVGKYGLMNFVSGGLLVGDRIQKPGDGEIKHSALLQRSDNAAGGSGTKRKAAEEEGSDEPKAKKRKQEARDKSEPRSTGAAASSGDVKNADQSRRKEKKKAKRAAKQPESNDASDSAAVEQKSKRRRKESPQDDAASTAKPSKEERARLKQEKRERKEDRRKRKEAKRLKKAKEQEVAPVNGSESKRPAAVAPQFSGGRHSVRHRYIQQKRMAGRDAQAMKEIFMVKAAA